MANEPLKLKDLSFADLLALHNFYEYEISEAVDNQGVPKIDEWSIEMQQHAEKEMKYLKRYIHGKFQKVKADSVKK